MTDSIDDTPTPTQSISATVRAVGAQQITVDTCGQRPDRGAHIAVAAPGVAVYLYTVAAATTYADAFIDVAASPLVAQLPELCGPGPADRAADAASPAVIVSAHASDRVRHFFVPDNQNEGGRAALGIRVGRIGWLMADRAAAESYLAAWRQVHNLIPLVLGRAPGQVPTP